MKYKIQNFNFFTSLSSDLNKKKNIFHRNFLLNKFFPLLPFELCWSIFSGHSPNSIHQLFFLLDNNYVEDGFSFLRFNYIHEFIKLAVCSPRWASFLNIGIKFNRTELLNGFISSVFRKIIFKNKILICSEINFLCLQKKMRKKFFVQELIKEITRRLNCFAITNAVYTSGLSFIKPLLNINYYYNNLNLSQDFKINGTKNEDLNAKKLKTNKIFQNFEYLDKEYFKNLSNLKILREQFKKKKIYKHFDQTDFFYWIRFVRGFKYTFMEKKNFLIDKKSMISFYSLPCKTIQSKRPFYFYDAYFYYGIQLFENKIFIQKILFMCKLIGFDLFYILEGIYSEKNLLNSNFKKGNAKINFYFLGTELEEIYPYENGLIFF